MIVAAIYAYRRFTEGTAEELKASKKIPSLGRFLVGWGVVFLGLSSLAEVWPEAAGNMSILIVLGSLLTNGTEIAKDLNAGLGKAEPVKGKAAKDTVKSADTSADGPSSHTSSATITAERAATIFSPRF